MVQSFYKTLTLTLPSIPAGLLSTAIVIFITFVAAQFWKFVQYTVHQLNAREQDRDCLHHQKQVALRNCDTAEGLLPKLFKIHSSWKAPFGWWKTWTKILGLVVVASLYSVAFQAANLTSSFIWSSTGDEVQIRSPNCGYSILANTSNPQLQNDYKLQVLNQTITAETYVKQCYTTAPDPLQCGYYPQTQIKWNGRTTSCPFKSDDLCVTENSSPYEMDSGLLDSDTDFGINAAPANRIRIRKVTTCSPLHATRFVDTVNASVTDEANDWLPGTQLIRIYLGRTLDFDWTFEYNKFAPLDGFPYDLR